MTKLEKVNKFVIELKCGKSYTFYSVCDFLDVVSAIFPDGFEPDRLMAIKLSDSYSECILGNMSLCILVIPEEIRHVRLIGDVTE